MQRNDGLEKHQNFFFFGSFAKPSDFILLPEALPVHLLHLERTQIDPVDRPYVDGQLPLHARDGAEPVVVESVRGRDAAGGAEAVFGRFGAELVDG